MKNEEIPDNSGAPWNTQDVVFGGITCKELSRLCTCFVSAFRMASGEAELRGVKGSMALVADLINQQINLSNSANLTPEEKAAVEESLITGFQAVCLAGLFSVRQVDPRHLTAIGISTLQVVQKLSETTGPIGADDEVLIQTRKGEGSFDEESIEMGVRLESSLDLAGKLTSDNVGKEIKKIVKETQENNPDSSPYDQGLN